MRAPFRSAKSKTNPEASMPLIEHLRELRQRLVICIVAIALTSIVGYVWYGSHIFGLPTLGELLKGPYCAIPATSRGQFTVDEQCTLLATGPFDPFMLRLKVAISVGVVLACPVWLYQIWMFITPGLRTNERRYALTFVGLGGLLFIAGALLAYFVISQGLFFLLTIGDDVQTTALSGSEYFSFLTSALLIFGISFEIPLIVVMMNMAGLVSYVRLQAWRRGILFGTFVFAAIATPGQDPYSMLGLAFGLAILLELAIQVARLNDKRRAHRREADGWDDWDPDQPSPIDTSPSRLSDPSLKRHDSSDGLKEPQSGPMPELDDIT